MSKTLKTDIWNEGCPCGEFETPNIKGCVSCRKSNGSRDVSGDLLEATVLTDKETALEDLFEVVKLIGEDRDITMHIH